MAPNVICVFFLIVQTDELRRGSFCHGEDKVYSCLETTITEEKLVLVVSGYPELYDLINRNHQDLNKKQQPGSK